MKESVHAVDEAIAHLKRQDKALGRAISRLPRFPGFPDADSRRRSHFESLARAIVYQQLAGKAAATIFGRVVALTPGPRFPNAEALLALDEGALRGAGLSANKLRALRDLAERVTDGRLPLSRLSRLGDEEIVAALTEVRGVGVWTAQMFLMFKLGRLDVMPAADLGVQDGVRLLYGLKERPKPAAVEEVGERWRPYRSVASWYCWRVVEAERAR